MVDYTLQNLQYHARACYSVAPVLLAQDSNYLKGIKWICPNCTEISSTRHWSVQRHIIRKHYGIGEPVSLNTRKSRREMNILPVNYGLSSNPSPLKYGSPTSLYFPFNQEKSYKNNFDNFLNKTLDLQDRIIRGRILEKLIKFNNILQQRQNLNFFIQKSLESCTVRASIYSA